MAGFGSPSGFQDTKTRTAPTRRTGPKPLNRYPRYFARVLDLGGVGALRPNSLNLRDTCSGERPWAIDELRRRRTSSEDRVCHSREESSVHVVSVSLHVVSYKNIKCYLPFVAVSFAFAASAASFALVSSMLNDLLW